MNGLTMVMVSFEISNVLIVNLKVGPLDGPFPAVSSLWGIALSTANALQCSVFFFITFLWQFLDPLWFSSTIYCPWQLPVLSCDGRRILSYCQLSIKPCQTKFQFYFEKIGTYSTKFGSRRWWFTHTANYLFIKLIILGLKVVVNSAVVHLSASLLFPFSIRWACQGLPMFCW